MDISTLAIPAVSAIFGGAVTMAVNALREGGNYKFQALCAENQDPIHRRINEVKTAQSEMQRDIAIIKTQMQSASEINAEVKDLLLDVRAALPKGLKK